MYKRVLRVASVLISCLVVSFLFTGCTGDAGGRDRKEERDPVFRRAMARKNVEDVDGAIDFFNKALDRKPYLARAHLELGLLYDMKKQEYVRAVYHYQRYLELRPDAEKKQLIEDLIRQAKLSFAASLPHQPAGAIEEIAMLKRENAILRNQLESGQGGTAKPAAAARRAPAKPVSAEAKPPKPKPEPAQPAMQPYVVQAGDTLSSIAAKMYRDPNKWKTIYDANRGSLSSPESVRVGQTLLIPR